MRILTTTFLYLWRLVKSGIILMGAGAAILLAACVAVALLIYVDLPVHLPTPKAKINATALPITLYAGSEKIATLQPGFAIIRPIRFNQINRYTRQAVVADEDHTFWTNRGVNVKSIVRAAEADLNSHQIVQGGSSITEQYVKLRYTTGERSWTKKLGEITDAAQVARTLSKQTILTDYFNLVFFGDGATGLGSASEDYFGVPAQKLTLSQAATLVGIIPDPTGRDPRTHPAVADYWRQVVLGEMWHLGDISHRQYMTARADHLYVEDCDAHCGVTHLLPPPQCTGTSCVVGRASTGFHPPRHVTLVRVRPGDRLGPYPYFSSYVLQWLDQHLGSRKVSRGGFTVHTTLNLTLQKEAQQQVNIHTQGAPPPITESVVSVQPSTGFIRSWIGGSDYRKYQLDLASGGTEGFQGGSSFKPFVLAAGLQRHVFNLNTEIPAYASIQVPGCGGTCTIHNDEGDSVNGQPMTVAQATAQSINTVYIQLEEKVGVSHVAAMAHALGVSTINPSGNYGLDLTLGVYGVTPLDMASAYGVFANGGIRVPATPVAYITQGGHTILDLRHPHGRQIISPQVALQVTRALEGVITSGTGYPNAQIGRPAAGKTGTTSGPIGAWFSGYTPQLSTAVWMGNRYHPTPLINIEGVPEVYGGTIPALTWSAYMKQALAHQPSLTFKLFSSIGTPLEAPQQTSLTHSSTKSPTQVEPGAPTSPTTIIPSCDGQICNQINDDN